MAEPYKKFDDWLYEQDNYRPFIPILEVPKHIVSPKEIIQPELIKEKEEKEIKYREWISIDKIGYELESAWLKSRDDLIDDASFSRADFSPDYASVGEYVSPPFNNANDLFRDMKNNWGDASSPKCSLHIHVSFKNTSLYSVLMEYEFYEYFLQRMEKWATSYSYKGEDFWNRLRGKNKYATNEFHPDVQVNFKEKGHNRLSRRTMLHYPFGIFKTLENRLFPAFKEVKTAISATKAFINCVEDYLDSHPFQNKDISDTLFEENESPQIHDEIISDDRSDRKKTLKIKPFNFFTDYDELVNADVKFANIKFTPELKKHENDYEKVAMYAPLRPIKKKSIRRNIIKNRILDDSFKDVIKERILFEDANKVLQNLDGDFSDLEVKPKILDEIF